MSRGRRRALVALGAAIAVVVALVFFQAPRTRTPAAQPAVSGALDPCPAFRVGPVSAGGLPDLSFPCVAGGPAVHLGTSPGRPAVLNVWGTWCTPCRAELPLFQRLYDGDPAVTVLGLAVRDTLSSVRSYSAAAGLTLPSALDDSGRFLAAEGLGDIPVTYFLAADGSVAFRKIGPIASYDELVQLIAAHLGVTT